MGGQPAFTIVEHGKDLTQDGPNSQHYNVGIPGSDTRNWNWQANPNVPYWQDLPTAANFTHTSATTALDLVATVVAGTGSARAQVRFITNYANIGDAGLTVLEHDTGEITTGNGTFDLTDVTAIRPKNNQPAGMGVEATTVQTIAIELDASVTSQFARSVAASGGGPNNSKNTFRTTAFTCR